MTKNVLILWAELESPNFGVRVLARGLADGLPSDWTIRFASHRSPLDAGALSLKSLALAALLPWHPIRREFSRYDLILDVGEGDSFASIYGAKRFGKMLATKLAGARSGTPYVICPQTLGPWEGSFGRALAVQAMKKATKVWARDSSSRRRAEALGIGDVRSASDLVFAVDQPLQGGAGHVAHALLLNVSGLLWNTNSHVDHAKYRTLVESTIGKALAAGVSTALIVHVNAPGSADDDSAVAKELGERYGLHVYTPTSIDELRATIKSSRLLIGSRMHACLNALSLGVPAVALAYSDKFAPLFGDLGYRYSFDLRSSETISLEPDELLASEELQEATRSAGAKGRELTGAFLDSVRAIR
jgi:polysaccharide pyruvyl transferase WcaK-like protein